MRFGSVCSGIEAASVAWEHLGWECAFLSEIEKFPRAVLKHHYPDTKLYGDFTEIKANAKTRNIDVLVAGTPCQAFSVAGNRAGLDDLRGELTVEFIRLVDRVRPRWFVWENVPGVLTLDKGATFQTIIRLMGECGYSIAWRVLDAQYVRVDGFARAVPQRRRRLFVVGHLGDWRAAASVLFESQSRCGDSPPRRQAGQEVAGTLTSRTGASNFYGEENRLVPDISPTITAKMQGMKGWAPWNEADHLVPEVAPPLTSKMSKGTGGPSGDETQNLVVGFNHAYGNKKADPAEAEVAGVGYQCINHENPKAVDVAPTLSQEGKDRPLVVYDNHPHDSRLEEIKDGVGMTVTQQYGTGGGNTPIVLDARQDPISSEGVSLTLGTKDRGHALLTPEDLRVRKLTPEECERLQGFPTGWTNVPWNGKETSPDSLRYIVLGNSKAVNVARWIGTQIQMVDQILRKAA